MRICTGTEYDKDYCRVEKMGCVGCCYYNEKEDKNEQKVSERTKNKSDKAN